MFLVADLSSTSPSAAGTTPGQIVSPNSSDSPIVLANLSEYEDLFISAQLQGATGGTLDVYLQSWDGKDWVDWLHYTQLAALAPAASSMFMPHRATTTTIVTVGRNLTPALTAGTGVGGHPGEALRVLYVAGTGTTLGAAQTIRVLARKSWNR